MQSTEYFQTKLHKAPFETKVECFKGLLTEWSNKLATLELDEFQALRTCCSRIGWLTSGTYDLNKFKQDFVHHENGPYAPSNRCATNQLINLSDRSSMVRALYQICNEIDSDENWAMLTNRDKSQLLELVTPILIALDDPSLDQSKSIRAHTIFHSETAAGKSLFNTTIHGQSGSRTFILSEDPNFEVPHAKPCYDPENLSLFANFVFERIRGLRATLVREQRQIDIVIKTVPLEELKWELESSDPILQSLYRILPEGLATESSPYDFAFGYGLGSIICSLNPGMNAYLNDSISSANSPRLWLIV